MHPKKHSDITRREITVDVKVTGFFKVKMETSGSVSLNEIKENADKVLMDTDFGMLEDIHWDISDIY